MTREAEIEKAIAEVRELTRREEILAMDYIDLVINSEEKFNMKKFDIIPQEKSAQFLTFAWRVEEKLYEKLHAIGDIHKHKYIDNLSKLILSCSDCDLIHASPIDRLRAALLTLEGVE